jgi:hypothetical protein
MALSPSVVAANMAARARETEALKPAPVVPAPTPYELEKEADQAAIKLAQSRADEVLQEYGKAAPLPINGEAPMAYRRRLINEARAAMTLRPLDLEFAEKYQPEEVIKAEARTYADALKHAGDPPDLPAGQVREIIKEDKTGRTIHEFVGKSQGTFLNVYGHSIAPALISPICDGNPTNPQPLKPWF